MPRETKQQRLEREAAERAKYIADFKAAYHRHLLDVIVGCIQYMGAVVSKVTINNTNVEYYKIEYNTQYSTHDKRFPVCLDDTDSHDFLYDVDKELLMISLDIDAKKAELAEEERKRVLKADAERKVREVLTAEEYSAYIGEQ